MKIPLLGGFARFLRRRSWRFWLGLPVLLVLLAVAGLELLNQTGYLESYVRRRVTTELERASGGRVEIARVDFDRSGFAVILRGLTLSRPGQEPFVNVPRLRIGLGLHSFLGVPVLLRSLDLDQPAVRIQVAPDGSTNLPSPSPSPDGLDSDLVRWAVERIEVRDGRLEWNGEYIPLTFRADDLDFSTRLISATGCYGIDWTSGRLEWSPQTGAPIIGESTAELSLCGDSIPIEQVRVAFDGFAIQAAGSIEQLSDPRAEFTYHAAGPLSALRARIAPEQPLNADLTLDGSLVWSRADNTLAYQGSLALAKISFTAGALETNQASLAARYLGDADAVQLSELQADAFGGAFAGQARIEQLRAAPRLDLSGSILDFRLQPLLAALDPHTDLPLARVPWRSVLSAEVALRGASLEAFETELDITLSAPPAVGPNERPLAGRLVADYRSDTRDLRLSALDLHAPSSELSAHGDLNAQAGSRLDIEFSAGDSSDLETLLDLASVSPNDLPVELHAGLELAGELRAASTADRSSGLSFSGRLAAGALTLYGYRLDRLETGLDIAPGHWQISDLRLSDGDGLLSGDLALRPAGALPERLTPFDATLQARNLAAPKLLALLALPDWVSGRVDFDLQAGGSLDDLHYDGSLHAAGGALHSEPFDTLDLRVSSRDRAVDVSALEIQRADGRISGSGRYNPSERSFSFDLIARQWDLASSLLAHNEQLDPTGRLTFDISADGALGADNQAVERLRAAGAWQISDFSLNGRDYGSWQGQLSNDAETVSLDWSGAPLNGQARGRALLSLADLAFSGSGSFNSIDTAAAVSAVGLNLQAASGALDGHFEYSGNLENPDQFQASGSFEKLALDISGIPGSLRSYEIWNPFPMHWSFADSRLRLEHMRLQGVGTDIEVDGSVGLGDDRSLDLALEGDFNLSLLESLRADLQSSGLAVVNVAIKGSPDDPSIVGKISVRDGAVRSVDFPNGLTAIRGDLSLDGRELRIDDLTAVSGGGELRFTGVSRFAAADFEFRFNIDADRVRVRYPSSLSSVVDGRMVYSGNAGQSLLTGDIIVSRVATQRRLSLSDILAALREPTRTQPSSGALEGLQFNVHIVSGPEIVLETSTFRDLEANVDLSLVGTLASPSLLGRISIIQGRMSFQGTRYTINRGEINFVNPFRVEPVLDFEFETRIRDIDIALILAGPARKLNFSYRSDPPLSVPNLLNLVAVGRDPTFDPVSASQQRVQQQSLFQSGTTGVFNQALLGSSASGLQRFFGVSRLKVDPQAGGVEANPSARLSTEQQITNEITLTYTYDLSQSQQQTFRLEYSPERKWTFILTRDENGLVGADVLFKKRLN